MSIKLSIEITSPLGDDDRDLLSGIAVMTLAIANHEMAKNAFPETFGDETRAEATKPDPGPLRLPRRPRRDPDLHRGGRPSRPAPVPDDRRRGRRRGGPRAN